MRIIPFLSITFTLCLITALQAYGQTRTAAHDSTATTTVQINSEHFNLTAATEAQRARMEQRLERLRDLERQAQALVPVVTVTRCCR